MKDLPFPISEFRSRLTKVREAMDEIGVDVFLTHTPENIYYLTGYETPGYYMYQALIVPRDEEPILIVRLLEESNVKGLSWIKSSVTYTDSEDPIEVTTKTISDIGFENKKIGLEKDCWFLTPLQFERLKALLPKATIKDCGGIVERYRLIKSEREIEYIKRAAKIVEKGMEAGLAATEAGKTENEVAAKVLEALITAGSEYQGLPPFIASGYRSSLAHATWAGRKIKRGDLVFFELPGCVRRYHAALMRTAVVGEPKKKYKKVAEVVCNALENAIKTIKPGVTSGEVDRACRETIAKAGYGNLYPHRCGYSIGIAFPPDWGEGDIMSLRAGDPTLLRPNMTFHMPPIIFFYGEGAIGFSETVRVTEDGCEVITNFERKLFIKEK